MEKNNSKSKSSSFSDVSVSMEGPLPKGKAAGEYRRILFPRLSIARRAIPPLPLYTA